MRNPFELSAIPPDPLLGLMAQYRADARDNKIDLGVGVYRDEAGDTPIMQAVRFAEEARLLLDRTKVYEGPRGNGEFCEALKALVFGRNADGLCQRAISMVTPGGCGALYLAFQLAKRSRGSPRVWISDPSWSNHAHMVAQAALEKKKYRYRDATTGGLSFDAMMQDLSAAQPGDLVLVQGPCHNPSGVDLNVEQWRAFGDLCRKIGFLPLIDIAYHGLGQGLDEDLSGIRQTLAELPEGLISYSCSKNFGLYRERTGGLIALAPNSSKADVMGSHLDDISRAAYSMPPSHGAAIVATILRDADLTNVWLDELTFMRRRIRDLRTAFSTALIDAFEDEAFARIGTENGMFSLLPVRRDQANRLAEQFGIYLPGSGRVNIAGLTPDTATVVAQAMKTVSRS